MFTIDELQTIALSLACSELDPRGELENKVDQLIDFVRSIDEYTYSSPR